MGVVLKGTALNESINVIPIFNLEELAEKVISASKKDLKDNLHLSLSAGALINLNS